MGGGDSEKKPRLLDEETPSVPGTAGDGDKDRGRLQMLLDLTDKKHVGSSDWQSGRNIESRLCQQLSAIFSSPEQLSSMFSKRLLRLDGAEDGRPPDNAFGVDFQAARMLYQNIKALDAAPVIDAVMDASKKLLETYRISRASRASRGATPCDSESLIPCWLLILCNPLLLEPEHHSLLTALAKALTSLGVQDRTLVVSALATLPATELEELVAVVQQCITVQLYEASRVTEAVQLCTKLLKILYDANVRTRALPMSAFYNDGVNNPELIDPGQQYYYWQKPHRYAFSFCNYPFTLDLTTKCQILQLDSRLEQEQHFQRALLQGLISQGYLELFNIMRVRRDHLIHDAIMHVQRNREDLKKELRVQFIGEEAVDQGGVRKEFFQLVVQELFDPKYGMFSYNEETRQFWFSMQPFELDQVRAELERKRLRDVKEKRERHSTEGRGGSGEGAGTGAGAGTGPAAGAAAGGGGGGAERGEAITREDFWRDVRAGDAGSGEGDMGGDASGGGAASLAREESLSDFEFRKEYELVGMLLGLAIYNSCILEIRFPSALYKKLLGLPVTIHDLESLDKDLAKGLRDLLAFEGDVEEVYSQSFQVTVRDVYGEVQTVDLIPGGSQVPLTCDNREEYVALAIKFYLDISVRRQFEAFAKGFHHLVPKHILKLFDPGELELLVCGISELDFVELEKGAHYTDGYTQDHKTIKQFWEVAHALSDSDKRNLLMFATGCERAPIQGLASLKFTISRHGPDSHRLPSAHTCFNHLLLPEYSSQEKLKELLRVAINNSKGFGLQ